MCMYDQKYTGLISVLTTDNIVTYENRLLVIMGFLRVPMDAVRFS